MSGDFGAVQYSMWVCSDTTEPGDDAKYQKEQVWYDRDQGAANT